MADRKFTKISLPLLRGSTVPQSGTGRGWVPCAHLPFLPDFSNQKFILLLSRSGVKPLLKQKAPT